MSPTTTAMPAPGAQGTVSAARLVLLHTKFQFLETIRIPIAVIGNLLFPTLAVFFFVVPQPAAQQNPALAAAMVGQLAMFAVMSTFLFSFGTGVAEDRQQPFEPYVRTLPAGAGPRMAGRLITGCIFALMALVPLVLVGWLLTAAEVPVPVLLLAAALILVIGAPFLMLGLAVGYSLSAKAALAVVQVVLFPLAFAGGLFMPAEMFPDWLDTFSQFLPSRAGRDLLIGVLTGAEAYPLALPVLLAWGALFTALAVLAYRRDQGRRFH